MIAVFHRPSLPPALTDIERTELARLGLTGPRAHEWIAGRSALHRLLGPGTSVVTDPDGAPRVIAGAPLGHDGQSIGSTHASLGHDGHWVGGTHASLSHDGDWVAVAVSDRPVAIDLCGVEHRARAARILARLGIASETPTLTWAALECALKLRRRGVWTLLDSRLAVRGDAHGARVEGIGEPVRVAWHRAPAYALAWTSAPAAAIAPGARAAAGPDAHVDLGRDAVALAPTWDRAASAAIDARPDRGSAASSAGVGA